MLVGRRGDVGIGDTRFGEEEDDAGTLGGTKAAFDAHLLNLILGMANTCGVDESEEDVLNLDGVFDDIAGGALDVADDGSIIAKEGIEQRGFAHVGGTNDGYGDAVAKGLSGLEGGGEAGDFLVDVRGKLTKLGAVGKLYVLLAEIQFEFEEGGETEQLVVQGIELLADAALHLLQGKTVRGG